MPKASLTINARYKARPLTGVERFAFEIEKELRQRENLEVTEINPGRELSGLKGHAWEQLVLPLKIPASSTLFSPCNTGPIAVENQFVVIHDAAVWDYAQGFSRSFGTVYRTLLPQVARRSRWVATVSEFSRARLAEHLKLPEEKILVLGNAAASAFRPAATSEKTGPPRFFCVCSLDPRKNFKQLILAWESLQAKGALPDGTTLRIAGGANPRNFASVALADSPTVQWLGRISDEELVKEYQSATAFIFPSLYEGFGLPPLEAMACGCPILLSDRASLPEVGGPALGFRPEPSYRVQCETVQGTMGALKPKASSLKPGVPADGAVIYFDPTETESISSAIEQMLALGPEQVQQLSANAVKRSRLFSWSALADKIQAALQEGA